MDVLGDSNEALLAYEGERTEVRDSNYGVSYLFLYGTMQTLYVQQDAVTEIRKTVGLEPSTWMNDEVRTARELRNKATGHPTRRSRSGSAHFMVRPGMTRSDFVLYSFEPSGAMRHQKVSVPWMITVQVPAVIAALNEATEALRARCTCDDPKSSPLEPVP
jgi:hypothetical protein